MKRSTKILLALSVLAALLVLVPLLMRYRAQSRLQAYKNELLASGEKLAISDLTPIFVTDGQKNAAALLQAASTLTSVGDFYPSGMKEIKPGRARVAWRQAELNQEVYPSGIFTNVWPLLRGARTNDAGTLAEIRDILSAGNIQFPLDYQQADLYSGGVAMKGRNLEMSVSSEVILDLHDGKTNEAMQSLMLSVALPKLCADEPLTISQLIGYAELAMAITPCWEALQFKGWTDPQLAQLQKQWETLDFLSAAANSLAMERARSSMTFDQMRASKETFDSMLTPLNPAGGPTDIWHDSLVNARQGFNELMGATASYPRYWLWSGIWSYDDERLFMQLRQDMIEAVRAAKKRLEVLKRIEDSSLEVVNSKCLLTETERPMIKRFVEQSLRAQTHVEMVTAAIALERYFLRHDKYPARLDDLAPFFVRRVPVDYMDGKDLRYRLQLDGSYLLYSVGTNGIDDGGDPTPPANMSSGLWRGRDWVWPGVATPEEVSAYEADEAQKAAKQRKSGNR
jgi:hypothetical protein